MSAAEGTRTITVHIPMTFIPRGGRKCIRIEGLPPSESRPGTNSIVKALARAFRWRNSIEAGHYSSITELAKTEKINQSYACRLLRLTLLAPVIIDAILDGKLETTIGQLAKPSPNCWAEQINKLDSSLPKTLEQFD